jgi:hypothetical protein
LVYVSEINIGTLMIVFCTFSFGHCVVCSLIYGFWLPLRYLQTLLTVQCNSVSNCMLDGLAWKKMDVFSHTGTFETSIHSMKWWCWCLLCTRSTPKIELYIYTRTSNLKKFQIFWHINICTILVSEYRFRNNGSIFKPL